MAYDFHYTPTGTGVISGKEVLEQTEDAINDLGNTAISGVQEALDKAEQALTNSADAVDDAQTALNTANNAEGVAIQAQNDVSNLSGTVTNIGNRVTTAEGNITNLQGRMTTAEGNITNLQTAVSTAQATANSAQQTATTARQQSYVFRYSGTAITNNSTIAYSTIDNTDNIKSGDKILDVDGKLFEITAVDTTNEIVTVGSALVDLALDSNVVHTSGNETVDGQKTFSDNLTIYNSDNTQTPKGLVIRNAQWVMGETSARTTSNINFLDKNSAIPASVIASKGLYGQTFLRFSVRTKDSQNNTYTEEIYYDIDTSGNVEFRSWHDNNINLGSSAYKWKNVYATNYYYGADNIEFSTKFVTTDTAQTINDVKTFSKGLRIYNTNTSDNTSSVILRTSKVSMGSTTDGGDSLSVMFNDRGDSLLSSVRCTKISNGTTQLRNIVNTMDTSDNIITCETQLNVAKNGDKSFVPSVDSQIDCGTSSNRWKTFNGLTPSSLSMPIIDRTKYVDISGYFTNTGNADVNTYSVTANGWIFLRLADISSCQVQILDDGDNLLYGQSFTGGIEQILIPVLNGVKLKTQWATATSVNVVNARFIPCQGNV